MLLLGTTPVLERSDRLSIYFSSGTEAAGSISSDVSAVAETPMFFVKQKSKTF